MLVMIFKQFPTNKLSLCLKLWCIF